MICDEASKMYVSGTYINFGKKYPKKRHHLEDTHSEGKIKKTIYDTKVENEYIDWTHLAQDVGQWRDIKTSSLHSGPQRFPLIVD